jgi:hypothetical protein
VIFTRALVQSLKPKLFIMHPADYAAFIGVRRTRVGRWVWQGRTYRTRALAMRRVPHVTEVPAARATIMLDTDRVAKQGTMLVMDREPAVPWIFWEM